MMHDIYAETTLTAVARQGDSLRGHRAETTETAVTSVAALRPTAEAAARERRGTRTDLQLPGNLPGSWRARDDVAAAVGMSGRTYQKAAAVAARRMAELDPATRYKRGGAITAPAVIAQQRRSENRDLLAELDPAVPPSVRRHGRDTTAGAVVSQQRRSENRHLLALSEEAARRMAELDPATRYKRGGGIAAPAAIAHQRRSENRDLLALSEEEVRMAELDPAAAHGGPGGGSAKSAVADIAKQRRSENRDLEPPDCDCPACAALAAAIDADLAARRRVREAAEAVDRHHGLVGPRGAVESSELPAPQYRAGPSLSVRAASGGAVR